MLSNLVPLPPKNLKDPPYSGGLASFTVIGSSACTSQQAYHKDKHLLCFLNTSTVYA